jgi:hypothetical protein
MRLERQDAKEEGRKKERIHLIRKMSENRFSAEKIAEVFEENLEFVQHVLALSETHPEITDETIYELWTAATANNPR